MCDPHRPHFIDLTGQRFGKLEVLRLVSRKHKNTVWLCRCDCGEEIEAFGNKLREAERDHRELECPLCKQARFDAVYRKRVAGESVADLARELGVSQSTISEICQRVEHALARARSRAARICTLCCNLPWQVHGGQCLLCGLPYAEEPPLHAVVTQVSSSANGLYSGSR